MIVAYYFSDKVESALGAFSCDNITDGLTQLIDVMKSIKDDKILDTAKEYARGCKVNMTLQCIDTWSDEFNDAFDIFEYKLIEE